MDINNNMNNNLNNNQDETKIHGTNIGVVIGIIVLVAVVFASVKMFIEIYDEFNDFSEKVTNNLPTNIPQVIPDDELDNGDENIDDEVVQTNPYEKYKNITWCDTEDTVKTMKIYIDDGKVYSNNEGTIKEWKTVGSPKKVHFNDPAPEAIMLTEEGKVYDIYYDSCTLVEELSKYTIVDMTYTNNYTYEYFYFLTSDGKLIDRNGVPFDKYGFVDRIEFGKAWWIPVDKNGYGYHWDNEEDVYQAITNNTKSKLSLSKVYAFEEYVLIETAYKKLFKYDGLTSIAKQESNSTVTKTERKTSGENVSIVFTFADGTTKEYSEPTGGFNVKTDKEIDIDNLSKYVEVSKETLTDHVEELEKLSDALQQMIWNVFNGKTMTGAEALACFQQYQNSDVSIVVITNSNGTAYTGKYKLDENNLKVKNVDTAETVKEHKPYEDGVYYMGDVINFDTNIKRTPFADLSDKFKVNSAQTYYTSLIRDKLGDVCGILFMQK